MAASPHDYLTNVEDEINDPASFLPTALRHDGKNLLWIKPAYATYRGTPVMAKTIESSFLCDHMERMSKQSTITAHQEEYIGEYTLAAATLDHWYSHNQNHNKFTMEEAIKTWKLTCDKLTQNPFFSMGWYVPAFYPFYSYQCMVGLQDFPKEAWSMIFKLMEGFQGHHKTHMPRNFKTKPGKEAKGDKENAQILNKHFHSLFNSETKVDTTVLDRLPQYEKAHQLDGTPT
jgi:hypothetical protein